MGTIHFQLPADLPGDLASALDRAGMTGGQDNMPYATMVIRNGVGLDIQRGGDDSGRVIAPWSVENAGQLMVSTATLIERPAPYQLAVELARGKINQLRNQSSDWQMGGLQVPPPLAQTIRDATLQFGRA